MWNILLNVAIKEMPFHHMHTCTCTKAISYMKFSVWKKSQLNYLRFNGIWNINKSGISLLLFLLNWKYIYYRWTSQTKISWYFLWYFKRTKCTCYQVSFTTFIHITYNFIGIIFKMLPNKRFLRENLKFFNFMHMYFEWYVTQNDSASLIDERKWMRKK